MKPIDFVLEFVPAYLVSSIGTKEGYTSTSYVTYRRRRTDPSVAEQSRAEESRARHPPPPPPPPLPSPPALLRLVNYLIRLSCNHHPRLLSRVYGNAPPMGLSLPTVKLTFLPSTHVRTAIPKMT